MPSRTPGIGLAAAVAGAFGICCGIPILATIGVVGLLAGLSTASWALIGLGAATAAFGGWRRLHRCRHSGTGSRIVEPAKSAPAGYQVEAVDVDPSKEL